MMHSSCWLTAKRARQQSQASSCCSVHTVVWHHGCKVPHVVSCDRQCGLGLDHIPATYCHSDWEVRDSHWPSMSIDSHSQPADTDLDRISATISRLQAAQPLHTFIRIDAEMITKRAALQHALGVDNTVKAAHLTHTSALLCPCARTSAGCRHQSAPWSRRGMSSCWPAGTQCRLDAEERGLHRCLGHGLGWNRCSFPTGVLMC